MANVILRCSYEKKQIKNVSPLFSQWIIYNGLLDSFCIEWNDNNLKFCDLILGKELFVCAYVDLIWSPKYEVFCAFHFCERAQVH